MAVRTTRRRWLRAPSPAMVVASLALAIALSGVGYAAVALPRGSVGTVQLKKDAVNSTKVKDRSLKAVDFANGQLPAGAQGAQGPQGPAGAQGPPGAPNPNALNSDLLDNLDSSAFLRTTGKAADAELLDGLNSTSFLGATGKAADAELLDGLNSTSFLGATAKAVDAEKLDNLDSTAFMRGKGTVVHGARAYSPALVAEFLDVPGFFDVWYQCPSSLTLNGTLSFRNMSTDALNVFHDSGGPNPTYVLKPAEGSFLNVPAAATGDSFVFQVQGAPGVAVLNIGTVHRASDCHAQGLATVSRP